MNMTGSVPLAAAIACCLAAPIGLRAQQPKPQTAHAFDCYVQAAEARIAARPPLEAAGGKVRTTPANGSNPHALPGGQLYDWIGAIFIPRATLDRTIRMLQDYDHRVRYFPEILSASHLLCRTGDHRFGFVMQLKEPAPIETRNDVVWEQAGPSLWRCRSYSTEAREIGGNHGYLQRLYSYWRFEAKDGGVHVEAETITLSAEFGSVTRMIGSMMGINPEKSLKKTLESMRDSVLRTDLEIPRPPASVTDCGEVFRPAACDAR